MFCKIFSDDQEIATNQKIVHCRTESGSAASKVAYMYVDKGAIRQTDSGPIVIS